MQSCGPHLSTCSGGMCSGTSIVAAEGGSGCRERESGSLRAKRAAHFHHRLPRALCHAAVTAMARTQGHNSSGEHAWGVHAMSGRLGPLKGLPASRSSRSERARNTNPAPSARGVLLQNKPARTMRALALAALLALLAAPISLAAEGFQRPTNGDCIALSTGSDVSLFPEQYMMVGDERSKDGFVTQARAGGCLPACAKSPPPPPPPPLVLGPMPRCISAALRQWPWHTRASLRL